MGKKRIIIDPNDGITAEELSEAGRVLQAGEIPSPESAPQQEAERQLLYTVGWWKGFRQWKCKQCPWDTVKNEADMLEHIAAVHTPLKSRILAAEKKIGGNR